MRRRRPGRRRSLNARAGRGAVQRNGRRRRAPCGADELGDAVEQFFVDVVHGMVAVTAGFPIKIFIDKPVF